MPELISVSRDLSSHDHQQLRNHMQETNHLLPDDVSVKWLEVGSVALRLLSAGEYHNALNEPGGALSTLPIEEVSELLTEAMKPRKRDPGILGAKSTETRFMGARKFLGIAYMLDSPELMEQRRRITELLDTLNEVPTDWRRFRPHVSAVTINTTGRSSDILETFDKIRPAELHFRPAQVVVN